MGTQSVRCKDRMAWSREALSEKKEEHWYAVYVKSRHEKLVARQFEELQVPHWLPLLERRKKWSDRIKITAEPLFPGYLFTHLAYGDCLEVYKARGVVKLVGFNGRPCPIPEDQIQAVRIALERRQCDPCPWLCRGMEVEVVRGPLKGHRGKLLRKDKQHRLALSVPLIGQSVIVDIDIGDVGPV